MTLNEMRYVFPVYAEKERKLDDKDIAQAVNVGGSPARGEIYRHYKGGLYTVVARAIKEDTLEPLVIYQSNAKGTIWARTLDDWSQQVDRGTPSQLQPRFSRAKD